MKCICYLINKINYLNLLKKDWIRTYDQTLNAGATRVKFICHSLVNKLIQFSDGYFLFQGHIESTTATAITDQDNIGIKNCSVFKDIKISFNNNQVEHLRNPMMSTTFLNMLEYSTDYARSIATESGFVKDTSLGEGDGETARHVLVRGMHANDQFPITVKVPLHQVSQFLDV